eukprot:SAG22_NODE_1766_length_3623_cov_2.997162_5_plen_410_part_00
MSAQGVYIRWDDICYDVDDTHSKEKNATKRILHNVHGSAAPGEMLAIMGPSGCGKSSLLNALAQRKKAEEGITGTITLNGQPIPDNFNRLSGYVTQDFVFFEHLTVRETVLVSAMLRLPRTLSKAEKVGRADELLRELDLWGAKDTPVGAPVVAGHEDGGISGGERRRLCIAMELMNDPYLLFLDEPTSGLDAASALMVIGVLRRLAEKGKTIVCVIHQPRASILPEFEHVLLLGGGKQVYYGPSCRFDDPATGQKIETDPLRQFFAEAGHPCPAFENPADFILDIINTTAPDSAAPAGAGDTADTAAAGKADAEGGGGGAVSAEQVGMLSPTGSTGTGGLPDDRKKVVEDLRGRYAGSALKTEMDGKAVRGAAVPLPEIESTSKYANGWCTQFWVLLGRTLKLKFRDP